MSEPGILFVILALTLTLFIWGYWRYDIVAALSLFACVALGLVPFSSAYSGFSNPAVITVACVMIITEAINRSGVVDYLIRHLTPITENATVHIGILTVFSAILSGFMNNVGALALMMPVALRTAAKARRSPSMVLLPLALGSALGGLTTAIGTPPNLLIANFRQSVVGHPFAMFDFTPVGVVVAVVGVCYVVFLGWRLIPIRRKSADQVEDMFHIQDYITEISIPENSNLVGKSVRDLEMLIEGDITILGLIRGGRKKLVFQPNEKLMVDDIVIVEASHTDLDKLLHAGKLTLVGDEKISKEVLRSDEVAVVEAVVSPGSQMEGRSSFSMRLRSRFHINLVAISRRGVAFTQRLSKVVLQGGDIIMLQGPAEMLRETIVSLGLLPLVERGVEVGIKKRAYVPFLIFFAAILIAALGFAPVQIAFGGAVVLMVVTKAIPVRNLYRSIEWPVIVLLGALIPVGGAMQATGGTDLIARTVIEYAGALPHVVILGMLMVITMFLSDLMNNAATAVVMAPIGISLAQGLNLNADPFLMGVAVASSCAFLTPIGHQNSVLVMGPGGYKFFDYFRVGIFLDIIVLAVALPMISWVWPF